ncbi:MarR family winged helix-turn-helix transcriptional regulator [Microbacterium marinilacus]|uniref:MarR family transcriptional regulator n=1 Tax=Microbacterium marinilacus TaxID=415209 RepID=A0ABP7BL09_9MICO|nr:MarR family transcriptional regulator [Microbacterium marinilacus]MBY0689748.1 MarR family transcriptional regulator [Microbacterium marinilacus]
MPDLSSDASEIRSATFRLARRLRQQRAVKTMSDGQFAVLVALKLHGPHTLTTLAEREGVTAPSMNRTVNHLEEEGYLTRRPDEADRRKVNIEITESGRSVIDETVHRPDEWLARLLAEVPAEDRATLRDAARIILEVIER